MSGAAAHGTMERRAEGMTRKQDSNQFWEKYKHPKWQEKRLAIMQRANFRCEHCDEAGKTLNVHHSYYERGFDPWDYPDASLHCLCESCHKEFDELRKDINRQIGRLDSYQLGEMLGFARGLELERNENGVSLKADNDEVLTGMMRAFMTLNGRDVNRHVNCAISVIGKDQLVDGEMLIDCVNHITEIDSMLDAKGASA
jgi:hypothetical protein